MKTTRLKKDLTKITEAFNTYLKVSRENIRLKNELIATYEKMLGFPVSRTLRVTFKK